MQVFWTLLPVMHCLDDEFHLYFRHFYKCTINTIGLIRHLCSTLTVILFGHSWHIRIFAHSSVWSAWHPGLNFVSVFLYRLWASTRRLTHRKLPSKKSMPEISFCLCLCRVVELTVNPSHSKSLLTLKTNLMIKALSYIFWKYWRVHLLSWCFKY